MEGPRRHRQASEGGVSMAIIPRRDDYVWAKPIWQLNEAEIDRMPRPDQDLVRRRLADLRESGNLAVILANPPATLFMTEWDRVGGTWRLMSIAAVATKGA